MAAGEFPGILTGASQLPSNHGTHANTTNDHKGAPDSPGLP